MQTSLTRDGFVGADTPAINRGESGSNERNREARKVERPRAISISDYAGFKARLRTHGTISDCPGRARQFFCINIPGNECTRYVRTRISIYVRTFFALSKTSPRMRHATN